MNNKSTLKSLIIIVAIIAMLLSGCKEIPPDSNDSSDESEVKSFKTLDELRAYVTENSPQTSYYSNRGGIMRSFAMEDSAPMMAVEKSSGASDYSTTNIQVAGVDEADFIKNDGQYIYIVKDNKLIIVNAFPAEDLSIVSETTLPGNAENLFLNGDKVVVFVNEERENKLGRIIPSYYPSPRIGIITFDVSDRIKPILTREVYYDGQYQNSRMVGEYVYALINQPFRYYNDDIYLPYVSMKEDGKEVRQTIDKMSPLYYFDSPSESYQFTTVVALNAVDDEEEITSRAYMLGSGSSIYMSEENLYVTYQHYPSTLETKDLYSEALKDLLLENVVSGIRGGDYSALEEYANTMSEEEMEEIGKKIEGRLQALQQKLQERQQQTIIHKINLMNDEIEYIGSGRVSGRILNQYSMDEFQGNFRIATTVDGIWTNKGQTKSKNNLYILDKNLESLGKIEGIAPGESIYSARFMGKRAYMVTFKRVDPLFVIDVSDPSNPEILGKLKIPGYSNYLHPYDETHLIGIGKEVDESIDADKVHDDDAVYYTAVQGIKIALFDVTDVNNPKEQSKLVLGDRGSDSPVLNDAKALLFDKKRNMLVLPVTLSKLKEGKNPYQDSEFTFSGAVVLSLDNFDIKERGRISHVDEKELKKYTYYYYGNDGVQRSLFMDDVLYTISGAKIKANDIDSLKDIKELVYSEATIDNYDVY